MGTMPPGVWVMRVWNRLVGGGGAVSLLIQLIGDNMLAADWTKFGTSPSPLQLVPFLRHHVFGAGVGHAEIALQGGGGYVPFFIPHVRWVDAVLIEQTSHVPRVLETPVAGR